MKTMQILTVLAFAAALGACNPQAAKTDAPADAAATSADATADTGAKPDEAAPAGGDAAKPEEPAQAPAGAAPDKPD
jgi:hypothetical protein